MLDKLNQFHALVLLVLRSVVGVIFLVHGYPKLIGGMENFVHTVSTRLGMPAFLAHVAAISEFCGGILLVLGLFTRWAALFISVVMVVAIKFHWEEGLVQGYELPLVLLAAALVLLVHGAGRWSIDKGILKKEC